MFKQIDYTMVVVSDMDRSVEFYRDKLGIPLKFQSPDWTEFQTERRRSRCTAAEWFRRRLRPETRPSTPAVARLASTSKISTRPMKNCKAKASAL